MFHLIWRSTRRCATPMAMTLAIALAACGGSDEPEATVAAGDDAVTLDWRSTASVDVLANDTANRGALSLASVDAPGHGTAAIEAGQLRYTPAPGWFGTDSVRYTVQSDAGASATASVTFTVQARMTLGGTITDAPIADAAVTLQVGDQRIDAMADDQGRYTADVVSADPAAWVQVAGASPDGRVRLVSVVGRLDGVAALADVQTGTVTATALPALDATHWTSAEAALRARALGGRLPANAEDMSASEAVLNGFDLQALAIAVNLVADHAVALPDGAADTFALLLDAGAAQAFLTAQATGNAQAYAAASAAVLASAPAPAGEPWAIAAPRVLSYSDGGNPVSGYDLTLALAPDGVATVHADGKRHAARWTATGAELDVVLTSPIEQASVECQPDPGTGACVQYASVFRTLGHRLRAVAGGSVVKKPVLLGTRYEHVWTEGPQQGEVISASDGSSRFLTTLFDVEGRSGVSADELVVGARLAGVASSPHEPAQSVTREDILRITGPGMAAFEISGQAATWSLDDGWITVHTAGMPARRFTRLERDPLTGLESWLTSTVPTDTGTPEVYSNGDDLLFADAGLAFTETSAARRWRSEGFVQVNPTASLAPSYVLNPDGSATGIVQRWRVAADGALELVRVYQGADYIRRWIPLRRVGANLIVLEIIDWTYLEPGMFTRRINWQVDLGPAGD